LHPKEARKMLRCSNDGAGGEIWHNREQADWLERG
jgi:hypothetical protein